MTILSLSQIADSFDLTEDDLRQQALMSFLKDKRREALRLRLEILSDYGVSDALELETKITTGAVAEHPAWENLIVVENLNFRLQEIDDHLQKLSG